MNSLWLLSHGIPAVSALQDLLPGVAVTSAEISSPRGRACWCRHKLLCVCTSAVLHNTAQIMGSLILLSDVAGFTFFASSDVENKSSTF